MINQKFNRWTVIAEAPSRNRKKYWLCQCDCGTQREVCGSDLRNNKSKSLDFIKKLSYDNKEKIKRRNFNK